MVALTTRDTLATTNPITRRKSRVISASHRSVVMALALPPQGGGPQGVGPHGQHRRVVRKFHQLTGDPLTGPGPGLMEDDLRSEEHTSELQSRENLVCRLLLE